MIEVRELKENELPDIWAIDRREVVENIYYFRNGELVLEPEHWDVPGWPVDVASRFDPVFQECFKRGGSFWGAFKGEIFVGVAILESKFIGSQKDTLQLTYLHVSHDARKQGLGKKLFLLAAEKAKSLGARKMYVSATPSENTVHFYQNLGCTLAEEVDAEFFAEEPDDIHLEYALR